MCTFGPRMSLFGLSLSEDSFFVPTISAPFVENHLSVLVCDPHSRTHLRQWARVRAHSTCDPDGACRLPLRFFPTIRSWVRTSITWEPFSVKNVASTSANPPSFLATSAEYCANCVVFGAPIALNVDFGNGVVPQDLCNTHELIQRWLKRCLSRRWHIARGCPRLAYIASMLFRWWCFSFCLCSPQSVCFISESDLEEELGLNCVSHHKTLPFVVCENKSSELCADSGTIANTWPWWLFWWMYCLYFVSGFSSSGETSEQCTAFLPLLCPKCTLAQVLQTLLKSSCRKVPRVVQKLCVPFFSDLIVRQRWNIHIVASMTLPSSDGNRFFVIQSLMNVWNQCLTSYPWSVFPATFNIYIYIFQGLRHQLLHNLERCHSSGMVSNTFHVLSPRYRTILFTFQYMSCQENCLFGKKHCLVVLHFEHNVSTAHRCRWLDRWAPESSFEMPLLRWSACFSLLAVTLPLLAVCTSSQHGTLLSTV